MKDRILEGYLEKAHRKDLIASIGFLETEYSAEFAFVYDEFVGGHREATGTVDVMKGFELDGILPSTQYGAAFFHGDIIFQKGERPQIRICHFTNSVTHLSEVTEAIVRKIVNDIPSVKTRIRMIFEVSGKRAPWYLKKGSSLTAGHGETKKSIVMKSRLRGGK